MDTNIFEDDFRIKTDYVQNWPLLVDLQRFSDFETLNLQLSKIEWDYESSRFNSQVPRMRLTLNNMESYAFGSPATSY